MAQNKRNANISMIIIIKVYQPSLPFVSTVVWVGAVGREHNWVIVPIDNYEDYVQNGA